MIHKIFSIYDSKAAAYLPPFILPREEMARRTFGDCCNASDHQFAAHPEDYSLFYLGTWDDESARYELEVPICLGLGLEYVRSNGEDNAVLESPVAPVGDGASIQPGSSSDDSKE